ncbi:hypothetical protein [Rhizorhabdus argentea]|uniref:hypothetical protein n=1 Tax=Rhizorhabdus argentea TaxID=1387174 RepID=UPI0030EE0358
MPELMLRGESYWTGKIQFDEFNTPILAQKAYDRQNAFVTFVPEGRRFKVGGFVKNIGDVETKGGAYYNGYTFQNSAVLNIHRTYGAEVNVKFQVPIRTTAGVPKRRVIWPLSGSPDSMPEVHCHMGRHRRVSYVRPSRVVRPAKSLNDRITEPPSCGCLMEN